ncbi:MAG: DUF2723 domain-containing protein [Flavobacteriales bacterium]|nr:DUF2723 domain-containing protein [Flavobacteriales bacterium]
MNFNRANVITGWLVWLIATIVYLLTIEPTASFWDCGEFIASANGLEVGHPPGAPLWMMLARFFIIFAPAGAAAMSVNVLSALCSSFTILFLFWSITHIAKKVAERQGEWSSGKLIAVLGSGTVGALMYALSDSFWFSAVEGEVYAMSSLFTALVFWAILKWETLADKGGELRWLVLIAYFMGLSIGVHLLNLLAIPAIAFVYYFKRYEVTPKGIIATLAISLGILGLIMIGIIQGVIKLAAKVELWFVNDLGLGFNSGVLFYAILILGFFIAALWYTRKKQLIGLNTLVLGSLVCLLGYSTFALIVIRSHANTPMDENNPENLFALLAYLNREQYGDRPLLYGQYFNTPTVLGDDYKDGESAFIKSYSIYEQTKSGEKRVQSFRWEWEAQEFMNEAQGQKYSVRQEYVNSRDKEGAVPNYDPRYCGYFPRMYSRQANHIPHYKEWSDYKGWNSGGREEVQKDEAKLREAETMIQQINAYQNQLLAQGKQAPAELRTEFNKQMRVRERMQEKLKPSFAEDMRYFLSFQNGWMYWRYFMWNFSGRQDDEQGHGDIIHGNWLSGVKFIDEQRLGNRDLLPESQLSNKGFNRYFYLPLILGLIGLFFHMIRMPKDFSVVALLFLLTGAAIVVYLNQYPLQPRERDYAYVGSFYAFAIWVGLGVYALFDAFKSLEKAGMIRLASMLLGGSLLFYIMEKMMGDSYALSYSLMYMAGIALVLFALMYGLRMIKFNEKGAAALTVIVGLIVPIIVGAEGWDDHSRAKRRTGVDFAKNYLDSVEPNAILFTNGDNDTFPLWYVQEVEGYRTDVRVVNLSLLNTDWYIDQMKYKAYNSDPVPFSMKEQQYRQGVRDYVYLDNSLNKNNAYIDLNRAMEICLDDSKAFTFSSGKPVQYLPSDKFSIPVDSAKVIDRGIVSVEDSARIVDAIEWTVTDGRGNPKSVIYKSSLLVLDLLRNNNWERPIYFAVTTGMDAYMGLTDYFQLEGLAYKLVPVKSPPNPNPNVVGAIAADIMYKNIMEEFQWGNMDDVSGNGIYMDENNRRMTTNLRLQCSNLAEQLVKEDKEEKALNILNKCIEVMPEKNVPYDRVMLPIIESFFALGPLDTTLVPQAKNSKLSPELQLEAQEMGKIVSTRLFELFEQDLEYFSSLEPEFAIIHAEDMDLKLSVSERLVRLYNFYLPGSEETQNLITRFEAMNELYNKKVDEINNRGKIGPVSF